MFQKILRQFIRLPHREDNLYGVLFLLFLVAPIIFTPLMQDGYEPIKLFVFLMLTAVALIVLIRRNNIFGNKYALILLGSFWIFNLISTIFSLDKINSLIGLPGRYPGSLIFISAWVIFIILIWSAIRNEESRRLSLIRVIVFQGLAISLLGLTQQFDIGYYSGLAEYARPIIPSFLGNQNFSSMYLLGAVAGIGVLWQKTQSRAASYYYAVTGLVVILAIALAGSRGAMLGLLATGIVYFVVALWRKYPKLNLVAILGMILFAVVLYFSFQPALRADQIGNAVSAAEYTTESRYIVWADSVGLIAQNPILGAGHGNFLLMFQGLGHTLMVGSQRFDDAHNLFLNLAVTTGLPSVLLFLAIIGLAVLLAWRQTRLKQASSLWAMAALAGISVAACFNPVSLSIWLLLALAISFAIGNETVEFPMQKLQKIVLAIVVAVLVIFSITFLASEILNQKSIQAYRLQQPQKAEKFAYFAITLNPFNSSARVHLIASRIRQKENLEQQAKEIDKLISQHPKAAGLYRAASNLYSMLYVATSDDQYRQRVNDLMITSQELEPNSAELIGAAAYLQYKMGQPELAMESLNRLLALPNNEKYPYSWLLRGVIYLNNGEKDKGLYAIEKASSILPGQPTLKHFIADVKESNDVSKLGAPIYFPDLDI